MFWVAAQRKIPNIADMSNFQPPRPDAGQSAPANFVIVASRFNEPLVDALVEHARAELVAMNPAVSIVIHRVPGAFEIPLLVQSTARELKPEAIIALGVIIEGETAHAHLIADTVTRSLLEISLRHQVPVIHEVLLVANEEQARRRCMELELNRGIEAARAAVGAALAMKPFKI